jgi:AcrR family transcriptional regulator
VRVFARQGFDAARLEDIAGEAGVSKGIIYLYFENKEDLFVAVVRSAVVPNLAAVRAIAQKFEGSLADLAPQLLSRVAKVLGDPTISALIRMVIAESRKFPGLARVWHQEIVSPLMTSVEKLIAQRQRRGEVRKGDPRYLVFSLVGPLLMAMLYRGVFAEVSAIHPDLARLGRQHAEMLLGGVLLKESN